MTITEKRLRAALRTPRPRYSPFEHPSRIWFGLETRHGGEAYRWEGRTRPAAAPEVIAQYTLRGEGRYAEGGREWAPGPGTVFFAHVPSDHVYWMPPQGAWTFFWLITDHPYVVERLARLKARRGAVVALAGEDDPAWLAGADLLAASAQHRFASPVDQEQALFDWLFANERQAESTRGGNARRRLLREVADLTRARLPRPYAVEELAAAHGMSRTHFSHHFRRVTGRTPAAHMLAVRLAEALRLMSDPALLLADIAARTGFADLTHFGKVFRAKWGLSPAAFRRARFRAG